MNTHRFTFEQAEMSPQWLKEAPGEHTPETEEYGIRSFLYAARRPFHPQRLMHILEQRDFPGVVRSKGFIWLAARHQFASAWSQAGPIINISYAGVWWATVSQEEWPDDEYFREELQALMEPVYGDRRQEIVFIGIQIKCEKITHSLNEALLTDEEMALGWEQWRAFLNPFVAWDLAVETDLGHDHVARLVN
ncbi:GTP-binding protein [Ktedonobacter robiniae]|uniref:CobW C-terminal domain-containing protein n=1 Tax=Ktedonobacter robiniae TaxID=2778365 RepID=A0ABQ3V789_9CHLR|nr:GTP-binding protein [Ktedonobacter robiniae]GHO60783.1 hypothetical protein KSB_92580 [Ktedonobacter robiniae]